MNYSGFEYSAYVKFFINLFALVNPIGLIPIFMSMTNHLSENERNKTNFYSNVSASIILCISLLFGDFILTVFGISVNSFRIAGGILIIMISLSMVNGDLIKNVKQEKSKNNSARKSSSISIVPLSMPLIAGPGAISSTIVWSNHNPGLINFFLCSIIIFSFFCFCWFLFKTGPIVVFYLGSSGINILTRIMGLLLMSLGIEFVTIGIKSIFSLI
ncbi:MAG TPA: YchE family NAAT transporter [Buchnera sp. (in: enterobacteria)]|nr:YchE family NAAT transporter [Buchnera sp. (in: enterobacteria)]